MMSRIPADGVTSAALAPARTRALARALVVPVALALAGSGAAALAASPDGNAARGTSAAAAKVPDPIAPLLDDEGDVMPSMPQAVPADPGARTRAGRYASPAQAGMLSHAHPRGVLQVTIKGRGADAVERSVQAAQRQHAGARLASDAPVFVSGADLRSAAAVADRLAASGLSRVWLVTPADAGSRSPAAVPSKGQAGKATP